MAATVPVLPVTALHAAARAEGATARRDELPTRQTPLAESAVHLVLGGAGFIGSHVAAELMRRGCTVMVADKQACSFMKSGELSSEFVLADLREQSECERLFARAAALAERTFGNRRVWAYLFAADMGGMGYITSHEPCLMLANTAITKNTLQACVEFHVERVFLASSACVYPEGLQVDAEKTPALKEGDAWPAKPQDGYGLEKLYGEELAMRVAQALSPPIQVRIARFHNVYGPRGTWMGGREKAPAAFLRKALLLKELDSLMPAHEERIEIWGDGTQTRTFCYIDDAVRGVLALMYSEEDTPVNIGSDEIVTIRQLALLAGSVAGFKNCELERRFTFKPDGPIGVQARSADISFAANALGWKPDIPLQEGLTRTAAWLVKQVAMMREAMGRQVSTQRELAATPWPSFVHGHFHSVRFHQDGGSSSGELKRFALLVPVTSRMRGRGVEDGVRGLLRSLRETLPPPRSDWQFDIHFGVDRGDAVCDPSRADALDLIRIVRGELPVAYALGNVTVNVRVFEYAPGNICRIWSDLAADAFSAGADFSVLLGDDIVLLSPGWYDAILDAFQKIASDTGLPFGFACVAFADAAFPGFPTFPVLHRTHAKVFSSGIFPSAFKNQDADPFLFQLYRAFGAARLEPRARLRNTIGGGGDARYTKRHVPWTGDILNAARASAARWLDLQIGVHAAARFTRHVTLDIVVPTYRVPQRRLEAILALQVPEGVSTQFTIVCDNPAHVPSQEVIAALQEMHRDNPMVRIRTNDLNIGAGPTRNRGLAESAADWVLFLDDDVVPDRSLLHNYARAIREHPRATGFIGHSELPAPATSRQAGVHIAGVAFFWGIARANPAHTELPWGVTANLCVRRPLPGTVEFCSAFPKTGGGEDIDFCLRLREAVRRSIDNSEGFVAVPDAIVRHPWWDDGTPHYSHFAGWAEGDGHLIDLYPEHTYRNVPDLAETLLTLSVVAAGQIGILAFQRAGMLARLPTPALSLLRSLASPQALLTTSVVAGACVVGDLITDSWQQLVEEPAAACAHLPLSTRVGGIAHGLAIRTASEAGRLIGHASRGRLMRNFGRRFNWFADMWPGAPSVERRQAIRRTAVRLLVAVATGFLHAGSAR